MFIPHSDIEREDMLKTIGVEKLEDLFRDIPSENLYPKLNLPPGITEIEALEELQNIASANETTQDLICFLGAGAYNHYTPAAVDNLLNRGEFYTAYTPYQPEISQGTLQAIFEYQSLIAALTGMDVSNASHYDGATAVAEAINMAYHHFRGKRSKVIISPAVHPHYRGTVQTYIQDSDIQVTGDNLPPDSGLDSLIDRIDEDTALVVVQYPDFLGRVFDYTHLVKVAHNVQSLVAIHANPLALGLLKPPGDFGADIVTGEGQSLGLSLSFGGPYLGIFATRQKFVRKMAGRLVGETKDNRGQRGYVLTLSTREQHIRREKATSNICSNQGLLALASAIYLCLLGKNGLRQVAELNYHKAHYAARVITDLDGYELAFDAPFFNEFVLRCPQPISKINAYLLGNDILGGYDLGQVYKGLDHHMLLAVTEKISKSEIDYLTHVLSEVSHD
jgi:glycine dehydrogenase subunit 1